MAAVQRALQIELQGALAEACTPRPAHTQAWLNPSEAMGSLLPDSHLKSSFCAEVSSKACRVLMPATVATLT